MAAWESLRTVWRTATPIKRGLIAGIPVVFVIAVSTAIAIAAMSGGGSDKSQAARADETPTATGTPTLTTEQVLQYFAAILPTPTPWKADVNGLVANNPTGGGAPAAQYVPAQGGTGPGPIVPTDMSLSIPAIGVNASVYARTMGTNGRMGDPSGAWDVIWYDFSENWPGYGGYPGSGNSNAVISGHVDYIRVGPAVFWSIRNLSPGDVITIGTPNGPINYSVQWSAWVGPNEDFTQYVTQTGGDVVTLVTCIGQFSGGHYSNRLIVRGARI